MLDSRSPFFTRWFSTTGTLATRHAAFGLGADAGFIRLDTGVIGFNIAAAAEVNSRACASENLYLRQPAVGTLTEEYSLCEP